jgi:hypothetical protein
MRGLLLATCIAVMVSSLACGSCSHQSPSSGDGPSTVSALDGLAEALPEADGPVAWPVTDGAVEAPPDLGAPDQIACPVGASDRDCQLCGAALPSSCQQVCPSVDCSVYPVPAACTAVCTGATCCTCTPVAGDIYYWRVPQLQPQCGSACTDMISRWQGYLADPAMVACTTATDCIVVGGQPSWDPCNGTSSIGYCGASANAMAYRGSTAASLETEFAASCKGHIGFDCGPGSPECISGKCVLQHWGCCLCRPDGGTDVGPDLPLTPNDGGGEIGGHEAGSNARGGDAGGG